MFNQFRRFMLGAIVIIMPLAHAEYTYEQMNTLRNDKEPLVSVFNKKNRLKVLKKISDPNQQNIIKEVFYRTMLDLLNNEKNVCELNTIDSFKKNIAFQGMDNGQESLEDYLKLLRSINAIDDILYRIVSAANVDYHKISKLKLNKRPLLIKKASQKLLENNNLYELFSGFKEFPDEKNNCTYQELFFVKQHIYLEDGKKSKNDKNVKPLINQAYLDKVISLETYNKLIYLHEDADIESRDLWLKTYLRVLFLAKNSMVPMNNKYQVKNIEDENAFSSEKIKRFSSLTRRRLLYRKYNETQIILLAQVLQKASRRMGVDPDTKSSRPIITQEFWIQNADGSGENYVEKIELDPQSQYNLARRLLRRDMTQLNMMDIFLKSEITYTDIVMAGLETGYVTLEDIEPVVKYDNLWNPETTKFEKISSFIFDIAGYGTFFLPTPWNITATIAMGVVEGLVDRKFLTGAENDNPATFIE